MGLQIMTIKKRNGDTAYAGSALFNSARISNMQTVDTNDTYFEYAMRSDDVVKEKFIVDDALATADSIYTAVDTTYYTLPVHDDVNDSSSSTTNKPIDAEDVVYAVAFGSDSTKCLLWEQQGGKLVKHLVNKSVNSIEDYIMTGTTTTAGA